MALVPIPIRRLSPGLSPSFRDLCSACSTRWSSTTASATDAREPESQTQGALAGIKVLDFGQVVAGNFAGALLAYFGADVIKVESPKGDALRTLRLLDDSGTSLWWRCHGRNRRCITLNLHHEEGRMLAKQGQKRQFVCLSSGLSEKVDVVLENFRPGVMEKWGLGPADLKPDLVYARISGYGQDGPKAPLPGYASVCEAYGGLRHLNGYPDRPPVRVNLSLGDTLAGLHAAFGTVMALLHRQRHSAAAPCGQVVDASISESVFNMLEACVTEVASAGYNRPPSGSTISDVVPSGTFQTLDGRYVVIGGNGDSVYSRLMAGIGRADMAADNPRYSTNSLRCEHEQEILREIEAWVASKNMEEVISTMKEARVPCGPILSTADIYADEHYRARGMFHAAHPPGDNGEVVLPAMLPKLSATPGGTRWAGPALGFHTEEVLKQELGLSDERLQQLRDCGAV